MRGDHVVNGDHVPAGLADEGNADVVHAVEEVDAQPAQRGRDEGQGPDDAALRAQEALVGRPPELLHDRAGCPGSGEDDEVQLRAARRRFREQRPRQVDRVTPGAAGPECQYLAVEPDSHLHSPARRRQSGCAVDRRRRVGRDAAGTDAAVRQARETTESGPGPGAVGDLTAITVPGAPAIAGAESAGTRPEPTRPDARRARPQKAGQARGAVGDLISMTVLGAPRQCRRTPKPAGSARALTRRRADRARRSLA